MPMGTSRPARPSDSNISGEAVRATLPGLLLCAGIAALGVALQMLEERWLGHPYLEGLVMAILLGIALRTVWRPGERWRRGIAFGAKQVLEFAVMLLGATLSLATLVASGPALLIGILVTVAGALAASYALCRLLGLPRRMAILIAAGNSICGNSAIAAVAPVIGARSEDVAAAIAFTAVLGVLVVLGLPLAVPLMGYSETQYGVLAGLTVYAVPQVLAATVPVGTLAVQVGTLVKLVRVLMLGPLVVGLSLVAARARLAGTTGERPGLSRLVPWFITGFLLLAASRSLGLVPDVVLAPLARLAGLLTIVSMAGLGLGVDVRVLAEIGGRATAAVTASLAVLFAISVALIRVLGLA